MLLLFMQEDVLAIKEEIGVNAAKVITHALIEF